MLPDLIAQQDADVVVDQVPGGVVHFGQLVEKLLAGALRDDHDRMVLAVHALDEVRQQRIGPLALQREFAFRHEAVVDVRIRQRRISRDKARVAPHDPHQADAVVGALRLVVRAGGEPAAGRDGGFETERLVDEADIVVDGLRNRDDADGEPATLRLHRNVVRAARGAVAADAEQQIDVHAHQRIDHHAGVFLAARGAEDGAALLVDVVGVLVGQHDGSELAGRVQPPVAVTDAVDDRHFVLTPQRAGQELDDVVQPRAEAAGRQHRRLAPGRVVIDPRARPRQFESRNRLSLPHIFGQFRGIAVVGDGRAVVDESGRRVERRIELRPAEARYLKILDIHGHSFLPLNNGYSLRYDKIDLSPEIATRITGFFQSLTVY